MRDIAGADREEEAESPVDKRKHRNIWLPEERLFLRIAEADRNLFTHRDQMKGTFHSSISFFFSALLRIIFVRSHLCAAALCTSVSLVCAGWIAVIGPP